MSRSDRRLAWSLLLTTSAACTFGNVGNYAVKSCDAPVGQATSSPLSVGAIDDDFIGFSSSSGVNAIAAFVTPAASGTCIEAIGQGASNLQVIDGPTCTFLSSDSALVPHQPTVIPLPNDAHAAAFVWTSACPVGRLGYRSTATNPVGMLDLDCTTTGAALPAIATIAGTTPTATVVAWYATGVDTRGEPITTCSTAQEASLMALVISNADGATPSGATPMTLDAASLSVLPPAIVSMPNGGVLVAAPQASGVGVWMVSAGSSVSTPVSIAGMKGAVGADIATDGATHVAVVAEIGCSQSIAFTVGTLAGGFNDVAVIAPAGSALVVSPKVAWVTATDRQDSRWLVTWLSTDGGTSHVEARWFDVDGKPLDASYAPGAAVTGAAVMSSANVIGYAPSSKAFVETSLGCAE